MGVEIKRLKSILNKGSFHSEVSTVANIALKNSIISRKKYFSSHAKSDSGITLDFKDINKFAIQKRGNLKVYQDLPRGIRVVAR
ncbi:MAG: hypothetical protein U9R39_00375 [Campylobacterota bacterium]|nr:hypothetical protein [Campylobacterota bacterium]